MDGYTQLIFDYNYLLDKQPDDFGYYLSYLEKPEVRRALQVGSTKYRNINDDVYDALSIDIPKSMAPEMVELLNAKYKVMRQ